MSDSSTTGPSLPKRLGGIWLTYAKGQMVMAAIVGLLMWTINAGMGLNRPLLVGVVAGLLQSVPTFGPLVAAVLAAVMGLVRGSSIISVEPWAFALIVLGVHLLVQQAVTLLIEPRIMGKRFSLPPLVVFIAVLVGAAVGNVVGAVIAVPLVASIREIVLEITAPRDPH